MNSPKHYYATTQGLYTRERSASEIEAQREYEYQLQLEAKRVIARLRAEGKRVVVHRSHSFDAANRGLPVLPQFTYRDGKYIAFTVR